MKRISIDLHSSEEKSAKPGKRTEPAARPDFTDKPGRAVPLKIKDEIGGPGGLEPTRFGDWEVNGRCTDF
jgi:hypothetical protein